METKIRKGNTSRYPGVYWHTTARAWVSRYRYRYIGQFDVEEEAFQAYMKHRKKVEGLHNIPTNYMALWASAWRIMCLRESVKVQEAHALMFSGGKTLLWSFNRG